MSDNLRVQYDVMRPATGRRVEKVLHQDGSWKLLSTETTWVLVSCQGWQSVIKHHCGALKGSPYWMLLEHATSPTKCAYCHEQMPEGIVALFKLQNWEVIR